MSCIPNDTTSGWLFVQEEIHLLFEGCSISAEYSTIEEILEEVQHMETVQKAINLLMNHGNNLEENPPKWSPIHKIRTAERGPHPTKGKDPSTLKRVTLFIIRVQGSKGPTKETTEEMEMNSKGENNRAGFLLREIQTEIPPWHSLLWM